MSDTTQQRETALAMAVSFGRDKPHVDYVDLVKGATMLYRFLVGPAFLKIRYSVVREQGSTPTGEEGGPVPQIKDTEEFDITLDEFDTKGVEVPDQAGDTSDDPTWSVDVDGALTLTVDPSNPRKCTVAGTNQIGSYVVTCDPQIPGVTPVTVAVDVVPGDRATVSVTESDPRPQTPSA
jgi:hypothetical protein